MIDPKQMARRRSERERMVRDQIAARGIRNRRLLEALASIPREEFIPPERRGEAYADKAVAVECQQTISMPFVVAEMTNLLDPRETDRILEVGAGTGYQTAVLAQLAGEIYAIEWHEPLLTAARERLTSLGIRNVHYRGGDGSAGWPEAAPFDGILVAAGAPAVPEPLKQQLGIGGRLVIPVGPRESETLLLVERTGPDRWEQTEVSKVRFVPLRGASGWGSDISG